jgi:hypothetical protein
VTFEEYLTSKKIDSNAFSLAQQEVWQEWQREFAQMHPNSFTAQKLFLINNIRRQFHLTPEPSPEERGVVTRPKPVIRPKIS